MVQFDHERRDEASLYTKRLDYENGFSPCVTYEGDSSIRGTFDYLKS